MPSFNHVQLIGHLTRDIELRAAGGTPVCDNALAINKKYKNKSGTLVEETTFVDITMWGRTAEIADEYLEKGRAICVHGELKQDTWQDKETGAKRSKLKVTVRELVMLGGKGQPQDKQQKTADDFYEDTPSGEVPF